MKKITVDELRNRLDDGAQLCLLDVREDHEHTEFNLGGMHLKLGLIQTMQIDPIENYKDSEIVVYCRSGYRSAQAALILETMGFKNVFNLEGGILAWKEKYIAAL